MHAEEIVRSIRELITNFCGISLADDITGTDNLFGEKVRLRASDLVFLVYELEERYSVEIAPDRLCDPNLATIDGLVDAVVS